ncbi:hypothetical protein [Phyllobacterium sp. YR531]|uniref:Pam3-gp28 family putative phage holin n=1 Tax=Phyllobacterium sp. YR531 TaxID=1144343 RepID=UPI00026FB23F|nr:hypothetical protein [Phyllobacterium sp. YR531]EJN04217.1 hypothetical protein PMI41_01856 [Phyllobacterium sp. YR531]
MDKTVIFNTVVLPMVRHFLQILSGYLVASGGLDQANAENLTGAFLAIISVGWWYYTKNSTKALTAAAQIDAKVPPSVSVQIKTPAGIPDITIPAAK